jgi:hypothetical protein
MPYNESNNFKTIMLNKSNINSDCSKLLPELKIYNYNEIILDIFRGLSEVGSKITASNHLRSITEENTEVLSLFKTVLQKLTTDKIIELPQAQKNMQDYRNENCAFLMREIDNKDIIQENISNITSEINAFNTQHDEIFENLNNLHGVITEMELIWGE